MIARRSFLIGTAAAGLGLGARDVGLAQPFPAGPSKVFTYDPLKDFAPIVTVGSTSLVLVVPASLPANSLQELITYAKANPGQLNVGFGQGTLPHLVSEAFKQATGTNIASIPYRGG